MLKLRIIIVTSHQQYGSRLFQCLQRHPDLSIRWQVSSFQHLMRMQGELPDVLLIDAELLGEKPMIRVERIRITYPQAKVIIVTDLLSEEVDYLLHACIVDGFLQRASACRIVASTVRIVGAGGYCIAHGQFSIRNFFRSNVKLDTNRPSNLTEKDLALITMISQGLSSTTIGERLCKSPRTVEKYRADLYTKLEVASKSDLIRQCVKWGLI